ncbi:MAG: hypothetical protein P8K08_10360 [Fuerstiella sp.]|jgi:hypothetical protein|nr:hypothetical protein [Fuerstiella sp.]
MTETESRNEKTRIALIPVLGLVLLYVLMGGEDTSGSQALQLVQQPDAASGCSVPKSDSAKSIGEVIWPGRSLQEIVAHNPFELMDPRAILDADFKRYGIREQTPMKEVDMVVFLENDVDIADAMELLTADSRDSVVQNGPETSTKDDVIAVSDPTAVAAAEARRDRIIAFQRRIRELQNTPVTMFMTSARGTSALIGNRKIAEGELLEDGILAVSINRNGITFEIVDDTDSQ